MSGAELIAAERRRQIEMGWTRAHDRAEHEPYELAAAALEYMRAKSPTAEHGNKWPWPGSAWKPKSRAQNLIRAGALYLAAVELAEHRGHGRQVLLYQAMAQECVNTLDEMDMAACS